MTFDQWQYARGWAELQGREVARVQARAPEPEPEPREPSTDDIGPRERWESDWQASRDLHR